MKQFLVAILCLSFYASVSFSQEAPEDTLKFECKAEPTILTDSVFGEISYSPVYVANRFTNKKNLNDTTEQMGYSYSVEINQFRDSNSYQTTRCSGSDGCWFTDICIVHNLTLIDPADLDRFFSECIERKRAECSPRSVICQTNSFSLEEKKSYIIDGSPGKITCEITNDQDGDEVPDDKDACDAESGSPSVGAPGEVYDEFWPNLSQRGCDKSNCTGSTCEGPKPAVSGGPRPEKGCSASGPLPDTQGGSIIECREQTLFQSISLTGTPFQLIYNSKQAGELLHPSRTAFFSIPFWSHPLADDSTFKLLQVYATLRVAGRSLEKVRSAAEHTSTWSDSITWDGLDAQGVPIKGITQAELETGYVYQRLGGEAIVEERVKTVNNLAFGIVVPRLTLAPGWTLDVQHVLDPATGIVYLGSGGSIKSENPGVPDQFAPDGNGNFNIPSVDGALVYRFNTQGWHIATFDAITGVRLLGFQYQEGQLASIIDANGLVTRLRRDLNGRIIAVVNHFGKTTRIRYNANGELINLEDPSGALQRFIYKSEAEDRSKGLMVNMIDALGKRKSYDYDPAGLLILAKDARGGSKAIERQETLTDTGLLKKVTFRSPLGRSTIYETLPSTDGTSGLKNTYPSGLVQTQSQSAMSKRFLDNVGTDLTIMSTAHPRYTSRFVPTSIEDKGLGGGTISKRFELIKNNPNNPLELVKFTEISSWEGRGDYVWSYDRQSRTSVNKTPLGRTRLDLLDEKGRVLSSKYGSFLPQSMTYDSLGRVVTMTQGTRIHKFTYDSQGMLATVENPLGEVTSYTYDANGELLAETIGGLKTLTYAYNPNRDVTSITNPEQAVYRYGFDNNRNLTLNTEPLIDSQAFSWSYRYNADDQPTATVQPDGTSINTQYNAEGLPSRIAGPRFNRSYNYENGIIRTIQHGTNQTLSFEGTKLPTRVSWEGATDGNIRFDWGTFGTLSRFTVNDTLPVDMAYNEDGELVQAHDLQMTRDPASGYITQIKQGVTVTNQMFNEYGELSGISVLNNGKPLLSFSYERDPLGRISQETSTKADQTSVSEYRYDAAGQLITESDDGVTKTYSYSPNGNRLTAQGAEKYDSHDRLIADAKWTYSYNANGHLERKNHQTDGRSILYTYDGLGNLLKVEHSNGAVVDYRVDGLSRRVKTLVNGAFRSSFIYFDGLRPAAQLNGNGSIRSVFVYGSRSNVPDLMIRNGESFRIISDHLGSPLFVIRASNGQIVQRMEYDSWGNVLLDTNPGFQPFGFAGGLYDSVTGLVRFGARDYDPTIGRWLNKDPIRFEGGWNLYGYVGNDPVNYFDSTGEGPEGAAVGSAVGGGLGAAIGAGFGGAGCTIFAPGIGTIACGGLGAPVGGVIGAAAGACIGSFIEDQWKFYTNKLKPDERASGAPHTSIKTDPASGKIRGYETWKPNPRNPSGYDSEKRVDVSGRPHNNVPTPHVHEGKQVRPAEPWEIPKR